MYIHIHAQFSNFKANPKTHTQSFITPPVSNMWMPDQIQFWTKKKTYSPREAKKKLDFDPRKLSTIKEWQSPSSWLFFFPHNVNSWTQFFFFIFLINKIFFKKNPLFKFPKIEIKYKFFIRKKKKETLNS